jgi:hypothetical protein
MVDWSMVDGLLMSRDELLGIGHWTLKVGNKRMLFNQIANLQFGK